MDPELRFIEANGVRLHVALAGPEDGELVVLLHGFPEFWKGMRAPLEAFAAAGYRVAAPDQRGYNLSDKPAGIDAYSVDVLAADVLALIEALGYRTAHVIGHDWGAAVTWWLAITAPERLGRLAVVNVPHPAVLAAQLRRNPRQLLRSWYMLAFQVPWLPDRVLTGPLSGVFASALQRTATPGALTDEYMADLQAAWAQPGAATGMINWYRAAFRRQPRGPRGLRVRDPILVLWGVHDVALNRTLVADSMEFCDDAHVTYFEHGTHWLLHDEPEAASAALLAWVRDGSA